jgi:integrase
MPRSAILKPAFRPKRDVKGLAAWVVNIPSELSPTGRRQELFFSTKNAAAVECEKLKARKDNFGISLKSLTAHEIHEATKCYELLKPHPDVTLTDAVRGFIEVTVRRSKSVPWKKVFDEYEGLPKKRSPKYLKDVAEVRASFDSLNEKIVVDISPDDLNACLAHLAPSTRNARLRIVRAVFNTAIKRRWLDQNPVHRLDFADLGTREVEVFSVAEVTKLLEAVRQAEIELLPYFVFGFFCGIRPDGELQKLEWSEVKIAEKQVVILPSVAKGGKRRRFPDISRNALAWLRVYRMAGGKCEGPVLPYGKSLLAKKRRELQKAAGIKKWIQQGMRHSFCSYWLAMHEDANKLVLQSGHTDSDTMWTRYHRGTTKAQAKKFWAINPPKVAPNVIAFEKVG